MADQKTGGNTWLIVGIIVIIIAAIVWYMSGSDSATTTPAETGDAVTVEPTAPAAEPGATSTTTEPAPAPAGTTAPAN